jgi:DNA-binding NarL/FixJ family response regulator
MQADRQTTVVILYRHALFGEGIAHLLSTESDLAVSSVSSEDTEASARSLAAGPDVVIFERGIPDTAVEVLRAVPDALVIDVDLNPGPTFTYHREVIPAAPGDIVRAIRDVNRDAGAPAVAAPGSAAAQVAAGLVGVGTAHRR